MKWYLSINVELVKDLLDKQETTKPHFRSRVYRTLNVDTMDMQDLNEAFQKMFINYEKYIRESSGWIMKTIIHLKLHTVKYTPLVGSSFIELPKALRRSRS